MIRRYSTKQQTINALLITFTVVLLLIQHSIAALFKQPKCKPHDYTVNIPIRINLLYAGSLPLFMREKSWNNDQIHKQFENALSSIVYHKASPKPPDTIISSFITASPNNYCSVIAYQYNYTFINLSEKILSRLDNTLKSLSENSSSMFIDTYIAADAFHQQLNLPPIKSSKEYNLLLYNSISAAPQRGYISEPGAAVTMSGYSQTQRFAFIDLAARPFFFSNGPPTIGETLLPFSKEFKGYAHTLHTACISLFTPSLTEEMRRFPPEDNLAFSLSEVDVSAVVGRLKGTAGDSLENVTMGISFDKNRFINILTALFQPPALPKKRVSIEVKDVNMDQDAYMAIAVARAFSTHELELVLDSQGLLRDLMKLKEKRGGYFVDASFIAHIPLYLFSFADSTRITHFAENELLRAKAIEKEAIFMVENRIRDPKIEERMSITSEAVKEVLQLICGLTKDTLDFVDARKEIVPLIVQDIVNRNVLTQELDWSDTIASWKARELLGYQGLDERLIPHEKGSVIQRGRNDLSNSVERLHSTWKQVGVSLSLTGLVGATLDVVEKSRVFETHLHEEICNQPLPEEILLKAEAELDADVGNMPTKKDTPSFVKWTLLPMLVGVLAGLSAYRESSKRKRPRDHSVLEIPIASKVTTVDMSRQTQWFSTLSQSDKPKLN